MPADKTRNFYLTKPATYSTLLEENITSKYKKINNEQVKAINCEAKDIAQELDLADRIEKIPESEAFITLKDHKQNFMNQPTCRLINPSKSEIGIISQTILQRINKEVRKATNLLQWRNTRDAIDWFRKIENKTEMEFLQCDIVHFYPSISEALLTDALTFASRYTTISAQDSEIIKHARKTVLFSNGEPWAKKSSLFDVSMGAFDGAEIAELVGLLILSQIKEQLPRLNFGLYRDDGLASYKTGRGIHIDHMRKKLLSIFKSHGLNITATFRLH